MSEPNAGTYVFGDELQRIFDSARDGYVLNGTKVGV